MQQGRERQFDIAGRNRSVDLTVNRTGSRSGERCWDQDFLAFLQQRFDELGTDAILDALDALDRDTPASASHHQAPPGDS